MGALELIYVQIQAAGRRKTIEPITGSFLGALGALGGYLLWQQI